MQHPARRLGQVLAVLVTLAATWAGAQVDSAPAATAPPDERARLRAELLLETEAALGSSSLDETRRRLERAAPLLERTSGPGATVLRQRWLLVAGLSLQLQADLAGARRAFDRIVANDPRSAEGLLALGTLQENLAVAPDRLLAIALASPKGFRERTRRDEVATIAASYYRHALEAEPALHEARLRLGRVLQVRGRGREARVELERVVASAAPVPERYLAHLFLGDLAERREAWPEARAHYRAALDLVPTAQAARLALAEASARSGDEAAAGAEVLALLQSPRDAEPDPWSVYFQPSPRRLTLALASLREAADADQAEASR